MSSEPHSIVAALMQARRAQGLTLLELGKRMGRSTAQTVWQWENVTRSPSLINVEQWAAALGYGLTLTPRQETGCTATRQGKGKGRRPGWVCTGRGLVILMHIPIDGVTLPVVAPQDRLDQIMAEPWAEAYDDPKPYVAGDHLHLVLPAKAKR